MLKYENPFGGERPVWVLGRVWTTLNGVRYLAVDDFRRRGWIRIEAEKDAQDGV